MICFTSLKERKKTMEKYQPENQEIQKILISK